MDSKALCGVIRADVGLVARIVRVANSVLFGRRPARTLEEAVITIGLRETCHVLVAASARLWEVPGSRARPLWRHALGTAIAAEALAMETGVSPIEPGPAGVMLPEVLQNVDERVPDLASRGEPAGVVAIRPDLRAPSERAVHRWREPDGEALEAARERMGVGGLDEHVHVVRLDGEMDHAELTSGCACQRPPK